MTTEADTQASSQSSQGQGNQSASAGGSQQDSSSQSTTQSSAASQQSQQAQTTKPARPDWLPETHWDAEKGIKPEFGQHFRDLTAFKAAEDSRKLTLPAKPEDYKLELTKNFKPPQGVEFKPNENDPVLPQARAFAQKYGLTQEAFSELVDLHAAGQVSSMQAINTAKAAEVTKLGPNGTARVTAAQTWMAAVDPDLGKHFSDFLFTEKQVLFVEKLMARERTQGAASPNNSGREPPQEQGKWSQAQYDAATPAQRLDYVRAHQTNGARAA